MTYATQTDLVDRFGEQEIRELTDRTGMGSEIDAAVLNKALLDADALVDAYLATKYTLPLSSPPTVVVGWAADIARFKLWDDRAPDEVRRRYEDALSQLKDVAKGVISLPPGTDGTAQKSGVDFASYSQTRAFTSDTLAGY